VISAAFTWAVPIKELQSEKDKANDKMIDMIPLFILSLLIVLFAVVSTI
jgi:hypothetical protein